MTILSNTFLFISIPEEVKNLISVQMNIINTINVMIDIMALQKIDGNNEQ